VRQDRHLLQQAFPDALTNPPASFFSIARNKEISPSISIILISKVTLLTLCIKVKYFVIQAGDTYLSTSVDLQDILPVSAPSS
jgi:hypothetical protein